MDTPPHSGYALIVGQQHPNWVSPPHDSLQFHITGNIATMRLVYSRPSHIMVQAFSRMPIQIGLLRANSHLLFFLARIPHCTDGWTDCPFALGRLPSRFRQPMERERSEGLALTACLVDRVDGVIKSLLTTSMSPSFCTELERMLGEQEDVVEGWSEARFQTDIAKAYQRWPHSDRMGADADFVERAGMPFAT